MTSASPLLMLSFILLGSCGSPYDYDTRHRSDLIEANDVIFDSWDSNGDELLDQAEQRAMVESDVEALTSGGIPPSADAMSSYMVAELNADDENGDGYLTRMEFLSSTLQEFDCMDQNGDQTLQPLELQSAGNCSESLPIIIPAQEARN